MERAEKVRRIEEHYRSFWQGDLEDLDRQLAPDFVSADMPDAPPGPESVKERARAARDAFSDMTVTVEEAIVEGPVVAVRATWRGTNTGPYLGREPTGRRVEVSGIMVWHFDDQGRIARNCSHVDYDGFLRQLEG